MKEIPLKQINALFFLIKNNGSNYTKIVNVIIDHETEIKNYVYESTNSAKSLEVHLRLLKTYIVSKAFISIN